MATRKKAARKVAVRRTTTESSSMNELFARYRGTIRGLDAHESTFVWSTEHPENQPTKVWTCDLASGNLEWLTLEYSATAQVLDGDTLWVAGTDGHLYSATIGSVPAKFGDAFDDRVVAMAPYDGGIAVVSGESLHLVPAKGKPTRFDLGVEGRSVASDPSGAWIVVGTTRGHIIVFHNESGDFEETARTRLHDGAVTALAFAPDELRVYSTGSDCRLLVSFVRGSFDTEDRGGNNMHEREVRAIQMGPDFATEDGTKARFFTAGLDSEIKSWPRGRSGSQRPSSQSAAVVQTSHLAVVDIDGQPHLVAAGLDESIRVFAFDEEGRVADCTTRIRGGYAWAEDRFRAAKPTDREEGFEQLAAFADARSLELLSQHLLNQESDHKLQVGGVKTLCDIDHEKVSQHLLSFFGHGTSDVRIEAFGGLLQRDDADTLDVLRAAAESGHEDLGLRAVDKARELGTESSIDLVRALLDHDNRAVRLAALTALETHHGTGPEGTLAGLRSAHADVRRTAITQLQRRGLLGSPRVDSRLRRLWDDDDQRTRLLAFVVATHRSTALVKALRQADEDFHRQVFELEEFGKDENKRRKEVPQAKKFDPKKLSEADFRPLLEAMGSRSIDVSLRGASCLASLGDERSFGTLLQLSRESDSGARVAVCKALATLGDPRSIRRIRAMLHDDASDVRDSAFSALGKLQSEEPLATVNAGLSAPAVDVRERALALLSATAKASDGPLGDEINVLFERALNDDASQVRLEAFKVLLNLAPKGHELETLRFIMRSTQWDVRNEVMREAMAHPKDEDYKQLLLELVDDPAEVIRGQAFQFGLDRWPSTDHERLFRAGLGAAHVGMRVIAVRSLAQQKGDIRKLLVEALNDDNTSVRIEAIRALVQAENNALLVDALDSGHLDVRVQAASALATLGDERALAPLVAVVDGYHELLANDGTPEEIGAYKQKLEVAVRGIQQLGHPGAIDAIVSLIEAEDTSVATAASAALPGIAAPSNLDAIRKITQHENDEIRLRAALALAYNGDATVAPLVFGSSHPHFALFAALGLRDDSPERLLSFVDSEDGTVRNLALAIVLSLELSEHTDAGVPERCLALLSAENPYIRLAAAEALEHYGDRPAFYRWVYDMLNGLSPDQHPWETDAANLLALSRAVTFGEPRIAVRAAQVLAQLLQTEADVFESQFAIFHDRYEDLLKELEKKANERPSEPLSEQIARAWHRIKARAKSLVVQPSSFDEALVSLAFGAYVGIARQQHAQNAHVLRAAAVSGLARLAPRDESFTRDAAAVMLLALGDNNQMVRERAFDALLSLECPEDVLSTEALSTGFNDMGFRGLELLAADPEGGNSLLEQTLLDSTNGLETEAAKLLAERVGWTEVHRIGLAASSESFRATSVRGLAEKYSSEEAAADALRGALASRHTDVQFRAARELAKRKDTAAYETLFDMLDSDDASDKRQALQSLETLRDARTPVDLVQRVTDLGDEVSDAVSVLNTAAGFADPSIGSSLLRLIDRDKQRAAAFEAAVLLSGYKQYEWVDDEDVTPSWEESLDPRHPDLFVELFELAYRIADTGMLSTLIGFTKWPPSNDELDQTLAALLTFSDDNIRHRTVEMVGWRLQNRAGPADGLKDVLSSRDPLDQFYAAEGLALAGHDEGLAVLRTAVDAIDDWSLRERAVLAIGTLAEPTTVDMLLELANDDANYLQKSAAEAIGHMSESERADEVFATLQRLSTSGSYDARESALRGLRWFGSPGAWALLRTQAKSDSWWIAQKCVELLRFDDDSVDVIKEVLRENDDWDVANAAVSSLRHIYGPDSLEPDYLLMEAKVSGLDEYEDAISRLRERGDAKRILEVLAHVPEENADEIVPGLVTILLTREPLPVDEAAFMLTSDKSRTASVAAQIVGRAGPEAAAQHGEPLGTAVEQAREQWLTAWDDFVANRRGARDRVEDIGIRYRKLVWAAGQVQVAAEEILAAAQLPDHELALGIREEAVTTLGEAWFGKRGVALLVELASGRDARLRSMAAAELDRAAPEESAKLIAKTLHDDVSFGRLLGSLDDDAATATLRSAMTEAAGVALPRLAALGDIEGLVDAMRNDDLGDSTRRGAIDALGTVVTDDAAEQLAEFGADEDQDELLRKAAWRARRRVTRALSTQEAP